MLPIIGFVLLILPCALSTERVITAYGGICTSPCSKSGNSYYWCWTMSYDLYDWDYCSPDKQLDYNGFICESDCNSYGYSYKWCENGRSWGYCGHITEVFEIFYTPYGHECITDCNKRGVYFQCKESKGNNELCSPSNDVTAKGEPCREDHSCDSYGESYDWCYTDQSGNWDYCGKITNYCENTSHRKKRQSGEELCRIIDTGNRRVTIFIAEPESRLSSPSRNQFMDAAEIISRITSTTVIPSRAGTMYYHNPVRLDMQGTFVRDGVRYYNLQVQLNGPRQDQSSVAQACVPVDLDVRIYYRYIRRALQTSLRGAYHDDPVRIFVIIERIL